VAWNMNGVGWRGYVPPRRGAGGSMAPLYNQGTGLPNGGGGGHDEL
jgi:hypothetical protein